MTDLPTKEDKPTAWLHYNVWVECPNCGNDIDLSEDDDGSFTTPLFNNQWGKLKDWDCHCEKCGHEFQIKEVDV